MAKKEKKIKLVKDEPKKQPADVTSEDIQALHEICLTITNRIDRIVAAISKAKSIKGM